MILFKALLLGFLIAAPVGPVNALCVQRTLAKSRLSGFISGLGAATVDGVYAALAAFGLVLVSSFSIRENFWFRLIGALALAIMGLWIFFAKKTRKIDVRKSGDPMNLAKDYFSTVLLTAANPTTIITFAVLFAALGFEFSPRGAASAAFATAGIFLGSAAWWLALSFAVKWISSKVEFSLKFVNEIAGIVIIIFALLILTPLF